MKDRNGSEIEVGKCATSHFAQVHGEYLFKVKKINLIDGVLCIGTEEIKDGTHISMLGVEVNEDLWYTVINNKAVLPKFNTQENVEKLINELSDKPSTEISLLMPQMKPSLFDNKLKNHVMKTQKEKFMKGVSDGRLGIKESEDKVYTYAYELGVIDRFHECNDDKLYDTWIYENECNDKTI